MLNRRKVLFAAALMAAALPAMPVMASDSRLLADILAGVSDALTRDYIRRHYQEGRWDGRQPEVAKRSNRYDAHPTAASGSTTTTGTIRRLRLRTVRRLRVTGLRLRRTSTDRAVVRLRLRGPRTLRAEGLREDRVRGLRSLRTVRARARRMQAVRVRLTSEGRAAGARAVQAVPADAAAPQPAPRRA